MREVIKHRGAKYKLDENEVNEIVDFIISGEVKFEELAEMYGVQLQYIKNIFNASGRFKYLLGTDRYFKMHETVKNKKEIAKNTEIKKRNKGISALTQPELDILYSRLHSGESGTKLSKIYGIDQSTLSKFKNNKLKVRGNIVGGYITDNENESTEGVIIETLKDNEIKEDLLKLARKTTAARKISGLDIMIKYLDVVGIHRLDELLTKNPHYKTALQNPFTNDMQTGLLLFEILNSITDYSINEIGMFLDEIKKNEVNNNGS